MRCQTHRNIRTSVARDLYDAWIVDIDAIRPREQAQSCRCVRRPPADPGGDRQMLVQCEASQHEARDALLEKKRRAHHKIIVRLTTGVRTWPCYRKAEFRTRTKSQAISTIGKCDNTFNVVIPVSTATEDTQGQVDLGARRINQHRHDRSHPNAESATVAFFFFLFGWFDRFLSWRGR